MHWVIQNNIYSEDGFETLITAIDRLGLSHSVHKVIPFVGEITDAEFLDTLPADTKFITMGSYSLARQAVKRGWKPGAYLDNLDFEIQLAHWGNRMFNAQAKIYPFAEVPFQEKPFFIRPVGDSKAFTGYVSDWADYTKWRDGLIRLPETADPVNDPLGINLLTVHTPVMVCPKRDIWSETRVWIVDGKVVTASGYKVGTIKRYSPPEAVDERITRYAQECADVWCPNRAFVLDVAESDTGGWTGGGLQIMEINNLNSAGFYKGDMNKLVMALETMEAS